MRKLTERNIVVLLSGGLDSTLLATMALRATCARLQACICVRYGQPHMEAEMQAARRWCEDHKVQRILLDLPLPSVAAMHTGIGTPGPREVPGRNLVMIAHAVQWAAANGGDEVWIGACADDCADYADCRPAFVEAANAVAQVYGVQVKAPLLFTTKKNVMRQAIALSVDVDATWSCYEPRSVGMRFLPCGTCNACVLRASACVDYVQAWPTE